MIYSSTTANITRALRLLQEGKLIGLPTETVYGLAALATEDQAVAQIFELKNRPIFNPLILHGASPEVFQKHVEWNDQADALATAFWPGPVTLVLPRRENSAVSLLASAGLRSLAVRIPRHPVTLTLLRELGSVLAAPSANRSGKLSPTQTHHVKSDFPDLFILEGGPCVVGLESTIVDLTGSFPTLLRPGGVPLEALEGLLGAFTLSSQEDIKAPGMLKSHYAPTLPLRLNAVGPHPAEGFLAFGPTIHTGNHVLNLSPKENLTEAAANLFKMLRLLDKECLEGIAVAPIPPQGLGRALNDRLQRAAAPRAPE